MSPILSNNDRRRTTRVLLASLVGTAVEFYDFYVYATAASLVFGPLFFPASSASAQLLAAYGSFGLAFVARPLGSIVFGHFGDRIGRKSTLVASLLLMGGSALLAVENAPDGYRARYGMVPQLGAPVGFVASNGLFLILGFALTPAQFEAWGWRLPFLASAFLVGVGLWVRLKLTETPAFAAAMAKAPPAEVPLADVLRGFPRETIAGTFAVVACFAIFYLATAFALGYGTGTLHYDRRVFLGVLLGAIPFLALGIVAAGVWSDRATPRRVLIAGCVATVGLGALLAPMLGSGSLAVIWLFLSLALFVMGFVYGPLGAWLPGLFPARVRYTGASLAFNVGGILGGGIAPLLAQSLANRGGLAYVGLYLGTAAAISLLALLSAPGRGLPAEAA
jgi:MFS family permease